MWMKQIYRTFLLSTIIKLIFIFWMLMSIETN